MQQLCDGEKNSSVECFYGSVKATVSCVYRDWGTWYNACSTDGCYKHVFSTENDLYECRTCWRIDAEVSVFFNDICVTNQLPLSVVADCNYMFNFVMNLVRLEYYFKMTMLRSKSLCLLDINLYNDLRFRLNNCWRVLLLTCCMNLKTWNYMTNWQQFLRT